MAPSPLITRLPIRHSRHRYSRSRHVMPYLSSTPTSFPRCRLISYLLAHSCSAVSRPSPSPICRQRLCHPLITIDRLHHHQSPYSLRHLRHSATHSNRLCHSSSRLRYRSPASLLSFTPRHALTIPDMYIHVIVEPPASK